MAPILVTGGAGFIGSIAVRRLIDLGYSVCVIDDLSTGHRTSVDSRAHFYEGDIADSELIASIFESHSIDTIIHFAASSLVEESIMKPEFYHQNNFENSRALLHQSSNLGVTKFLFSSTASVYGTSAEGPIDEMAVTAPINPYGATKLKFENYLRDFSRDSKLKSLVFRYFNVAGAMPDGSLGEKHEPETHLIPKVLLKILEGDKAPEVSVFGTDYPTPDGTCIRDYIHVLDLVDAHILGLEKVKDSPCEILNLGAARGFSVLEVIDAIQKTLKVKLNVLHSPRRRGDPASLVANSNRERDFLGWNPQRESLELMIEDSWKWLTK